MKHLWLLTNTADATYAGLVALCDTEHKLLYPNNELGVRLSNDGLLALVKVSTEKEDFIDTALQYASMITYYTEETHDDAAALMCTPEWTVEEGNYHGQ